MLALGDSYTIGQSVAEDERWPALLGSELLFAQIDLDLTIIAETGWTTNNLNQAIASSNLEESYDLVSLMIGVNNQFRGYSLDVFETEFSALFNQAIDFSGDQPGHVLVLSIPDWGTTPFGAAYDREQIAEDIDAYNAVIRHLCAQAGSHFIDVTAISRLAMQQPGLIAQDGLHPSAEMYALWVEVMLPKALRILK